MAFYRKHHKNKHELESSGIGELPPEYVKIEEIVYKNIDYFKSVLSDDEIFKLLYCLEDMCAFKRPPEETYREYVEPIIIKAANLGSEKESKINLILEEIEDCLKK